MLPIDRRIRDLASDLLVLDGLLSTLTDVLDIREVFDRVSQLVQRVLPHDGLGVTEISENSAGRNSQRSFSAPV